MTWLCNYKKLYDYIVSIRGKDIAPNYLGYYKNTESGIVAYSPIESSQLYFIIRHNDKMELDEELKKDYLILKKAQDLMPNKSTIKEMRVLYAGDERLDDSEWVKKMGLDISQYSNIMFDSKSLFNNIKYYYSVSNYSDDVSLLHNI